MGLGAPWSGRRRNLRRNMTKMKKGKEEKRRDDDDDNNDGGKEDEDEGDSVGRVGEGDRKSEGGHVSTRAGGSSGRW